MEQEKDTRRRRRYPPGLAVCDRAIASLRKFQDLIRHHRRLATQLPLARPIEDLLPPNTDPARRPVLIEQEINRLIPEVSMHLDSLGVPTRISYSKLEFDYESAKKKQVEHESDLIQDYFELVRRDGDAAFLKMTIAALDRGIGGYDTWKVGAYDRRKNPLSWLAYLISVPSRLLHQAGFDLDSTDSQVMAVYAFTIRALILIILAFVATKLGVSIPWTSFFK